MKFIAVVALLVALPGFWRTDEPGVVVCCAATVALAVFVLFLEHRSGKRTTS